MNTNITTVKHYLKMAAACPNLINRTIFDKFQPILEAYARGEVTLLSGKPNYAGDFSHKAHAYSLPMPFEAPKPVETAAPTAPPAPAAGLTMQDVESIIKRTVEITTMELTKSQRSASPTRVAVMPSM